MRLPTVFKRVVIITSLALLADVAIIALAPVLELLLGDKVITGLALIVAVTACRKPRQAFAGFVQEILWGHFLAYATSHEITRARFCTIRSMIEKQITSGSAGGTKKGFWRDVCVEIWHWGRGCVLEGYIIFIHSDEPGVILEIPTDVAPRAFLIHVDVLICQLNGKMIGKIF